MKSLELSTPQKTLYTPRPLLREHLWQLVIQLQSVISASLMRLCASGFSDPCIWCRDHISSFFFLVTLLLWKEDVLGSKNVPNNWEGRYLSLF